MARKKGPQVDIAYTYIKDKILTFEFAPGDELSDYKLEDVLNMSRSPINEAIMLLIADGLLVRNGNKTTISPMKLQDIIEICEVRKAIEIAALQILIQKGGMNEEQANELSRIFAQMKQETRLMENYQLDDAFHNLIVCAAGNSRMIEISERMRLQITRARWLNALTPSRLSLAVQEHEAILNALLSGNLTDSITALDKHLTASEDNFKYVLNLPAFNSKLLRGMATFTG